MRLFMGEMLCIAYQDPTAEYRKVESQGNVIIF
jgi:hypothetical protein